MNAGHEYGKAKAWAQANANRAGTTRWLHLYGGSYWIDREPVVGAERILPDPREPCDLECDDRRGHGEVFCRHGRKGIGA